MTYSYTNPYDLLLGGGSSLLSSLASGRTDARAAGAATDGRTLWPSNIPTFFASQPANAMGYGGGDYGKWGSYDNVISARNKAIQQSLASQQWGGDPQYSGMNQRQLEELGDSQRGGIFRNSDLTDLDRMWLYSNQYRGGNFKDLGTGAANLGMASPFVTTDEWRNAINSVGNTDLLGTTTAWTTGGYTGADSPYTALRGAVDFDKYESPFTRAYKSYMGIGEAPTSAPAPAPASASASAASTPTSAGTIGNFGDPITDPSPYLNPYVDWSNKQAMDKIQQSAAARGNLNSGATIKALSDYLTGSNQQNWNNAETTALADAARRYGVYNNDRNFDYNANVDDRNFNYNASVNDRNFNNSNLQYLANLGLSGTQGQSQLQQLLATLLSNNTIAAGQASGAGTIGSSNAVSNALQQIITQMLLGQYYTKG